ncbi:uncharacterized protein EAE98_007378 [Botrytis deweyae]|uniref:Uncharacterized protein n=1 Tax=Botrytis deweyae TaxID=2478750 RepID=A0ABQ7IHG2_9HELO|nr:uncharacterized protein EAE98_007378 [Botrytis deweyae]KAF7924327.1 hypothetical protein EAE98_007378 [Botrytis deweyae]
MTSSDPQGKGKGKAPNPSPASASTSSTSVPPAQITSNDTPSRLDEQPTPSLLNRIGASAAGLGRDVFAGGAGVGGESLRRDAQGLLVAAGNGKGGSTSAIARGNGNGDVGYTPMHRGNPRLTDGSSSMSRGVGDTLGMRSAGNVGTSGSGFQGAGGSGDSNGNAVGGDERARWIQQNEHAFSEFLDGLPSLTPAGDSGFGDGVSGSSYGMYESIPYGAPSNTVGKQALEDSWARSAQRGNDQREGYYGSRAVNAREPTIYHFEPLPAFHPDKMTAAEHRREVVNAISHRDAGYMNTDHHDISVQEQESRDGDEVRDLLSRIGGASFDEEIAGMDRGMSEMEIEGEDMKVYEREWMGMSSVERDRIIQATRGLFPEEVKNGGGVVHGGVDVENSLNLFPEYEREAEERWRGEREREMHREEEDDDDEFEGEVLNFQGIEWRVRKEKKHGDTKKGIRGKAKEEWKSDWEGVLKGYTDEVWGGLIPLVREAREELQIEEEKGDGGEGNEKGNLKALRRLGAVLGHLRGLDGSGK